MAKRPNNEMAATKRSALKTLHASFKILKENGGSMPRKLLLDEISRRVKFEPWENERYESNGQVKWQTIFLFYTVDSVKAGWLTKNKGVWYLTPKGEKAATLSPEDLFNAASQAYRKWAAERDKSEVSGGHPEDIEEELKIQTEDAKKVNIEQVETNANESIGSFLERMEEYDFQHLCAVLLKAMGFYIDFEAPPGRDGGVDIIALSDAIGFKKPRIKVQVKRHKESIKVDEKAIRELKALLHTGEDIGIFITSGYFTKNAEMYARSIDVHVKCINREEFIELWQSHYHKMTVEEKALLPLKPIYFLNSLE
jgi:restriction system protein